MWIGLFLWTVSQFCTIRQPIEVWSNFSVILWCLVSFDCAWWLAGHKPIQFCQFTAAQVLHNPSSYSNGCSPIVIGLRNKTALSVILCKSVISRPNRNRQNLFELSKNICQTPIGWRIVRISWRIVNLQNNPIHICNRHGFCQYH